MKIRRLYDALKYFVIGVLCLAMAGFLGTALQEAAHERDRGASLASIPNYNYVPDIRKLKSEGKLIEALEMARFVMRQSDMPGQAEASELEQELQSEIGSVWGRSKRVANGFVNGSGNSVEELCGGIASDMVIWGDIRDLLKQGYYGVTGNETDPVIVALAGVGLATEALDAADWAPAVLKAFRKIGALSRKFSDFLIMACKRSAKARKLDGALKTAFKNLRGLVDTMGLARASAIFKHVDAPADLSAIGKVAKKSADAAYFTVRNGGAEGVDVIRRLGGTEAGITAMTAAAKKGPSGIAWLKRGGTGHTVVLRTRLGTRVLKNLRLNRPQQLVAEMAVRYSGAMSALRLATVLCAFGGLLAWVRAVSRLWPVVRRP